jgi:predicted ATPase
MIGLPVQLSTFVGREDDITLVRDLLIARRLVTLTGPGGVGKTRLALAVAESLAGQFQDGVYYVPLASVTDPNLVASVIVTALDLHESSRYSPQDALTEFLATKQALLLLDNFEQIIDAASLIMTLLAECPDLKVLVTSRIPLHFIGEQEVPVEPLELPVNARLPPVGQLLRNEAIALFVQRAREHQPDFQLTSENAAAIVGICRRLEGLPLAIELAAARIRLLGPRALLARLDRRLPMLTTGTRNVPERQRTMYNTIEWSYGLLSQREQRLFRQISVCVRG